ncbi:formylglycine-generating enzyme family protein [Tenacibaculum tangerinum]|uniref:Formylglycine-generating enzyme family protein n=1 Tax=Tenacibaculum tangerinum TaxID=3038772 RepID=A0ABY8L205_9FLAO|nr:formylglycine-generating enzyme family protein [Tenacibaculum tangerinum]WGH75136.1 formylglycine-generating enzyme family protein [Tenacibaculum tangerinum]
MLTNLEAVQPNDKLLNDTSGMVLIKGGVFDMGGDTPENAKEMPATALAQPDEFPKHKVGVSDFYMDEHEVTVRQYLEFVKATGYKTVAEYDIDWNELKKQLPEGTPKPDNSLLEAGSLVFSYAPKGTPKDNLGNWWTFTKGVNWKNPDGSKPKLDAILNLPVTQVSWYDAMAYAKWANKRLPTEAEYEYAMRAGKNNTMYPWGNEMVASTMNKGNFLQGDFPYYNTVEDGFENVAPVKSFAPNAYGLYDISGNVWEWTLDWYGADYYDRLKKEHEVAMNPKGPEQTSEVYNAKATNKVVRGGSFLCNDDWCSGYRNARRMRLSPDSGMQHVGFRCVRTVTKNTQDAP